MGKSTNLKWEKEGLRKKGGEEMKGRRENGCEGGSQRGERVKGGLRCQKQ